jgi:5-methylcytosine-specific restriction endonuclease McrA
MIKFEFLEDRTFFEKLFCQENETIELYKNYFDFRLPSIKKEEFSAIKEELAEKLIPLAKDHCALSFHHVCDTDSGMAIDHFIPLSSSELNRHIRKMKSSGYKVIPSQSFGSNKEENIIVVCKNCYKQRNHKFVRLFRESEETSHDH